MKSSLPSVSKSREVAGSETPHSTHHVLVVDDDANLTRLMATILRTSGIEAVTASDGRSALDAIDHNEIDAIVLDEGTEWFQPSNIEATDITVGNPATNVIPAHASARLSIRYNDLHTGDALAARIEAIVHRHAPDATMVARVSGDAFVTAPGALSTLISDAIEARLGIKPELSTTGGTSDARFLSKLCPVVEFGLINATMHKLDEAVAVEDLAALVDIYADIIGRVAT